MPEVGAILIYNISARKVTPLRIAGPVLSVEMLSKNFDFEYQKGGKMPPVVHFEIAANDPDKVVARYQEVSGWKIVKAFRNNGWLGPAMRESRVSMKPCSAPKKYFQVSVPAPVPGMSMAPFSAFTR